LAFHSKVILSALLSEHTQTDTQPTNCYPLPQSGP